MSFPADFRWGVTSSSVQSEGVAPAADWSEWERTGMAPQSIDGSGVAVEFHDDLSLYAELGFTDIRLTVEWARIEPAPGKLDTSAIDLYRDMLSTARSLGLAPWVTLHSTSLPGWFNEDEGGYRDTKMRTRFWLPHVDRCAEAFGDTAEGFTPIDDPVGWAVRGYSLGSRPPGLRDPALVRDAAIAALEADHEAAQLIAAAGFRTMAVRGVPTIFALDDDAKPYVRWWAAMLFDSWIGALDNGELEIPDRGVIVRESWADDFDIIGLSFDHPIAIDGGGAFSPYPRSGRCSDTGFAPLPEELGVLLERMSDRMPNRDFVISANGVATTDDEWREQLMRETVGVLDSLVSDGIRLRGYFHDTGVDGYEWRKGFDTKRGLIDRDRNVKESGRYLATIMGGRPRPSERDDEPEEKEQ